MTKCIRRTWADWPQTTHKVEGGGGGGGGRGGGGGGGGGGEGEGWRGEG